MAPEANLSKLTAAEKDALILSLLPLVGQLQAVLARIAELEARLALLEQPPKTPDNSSLPPVRPDVIRVRLFGGRCVCCGECVVATAPAGLEPGSPFGKSIEAIVVYLRYARAAGIERLRLVFSELFGLSISEGALCNILARAQAPLEAAASSIATLVTTSDVVASDETSVLVMKNTCREWAELPKVLCGWAAARS